MSAPPPDDELRALIALEKEALVEPGDARSRLADRLAPELSPAPPIPPRFWGPWRLAILTGVVGFAAGVATGIAKRSPPVVEVRYVDRLVEVVVDGGAATAVSSAAPPVPSTTPRPARSAPAPSVSDDDLARERQVIDKARSALARRDSKAALAAVDEHAKSFPHGQLVEMREALAVQALVHDGRHDAARARAARFRRDFPGSVYLPVVEGAIASIP